jgi:hypothetical protein
MVTMATVTGDIDDSCNSEGGGSSSGGNALGPQQLQYQCDQESSCAIGAACETTLQLTVCQLRSNHGPSS